MTTENLHKNNSLPVAKSITADGQGFVTASLLYEFMESYVRDNAAPATNPGPINWDVPSIDIRCNGRSVIQADSNGLVFGQYPNEIRVDDTAISLFGSCIGMESSAIYNYGEGCGSMMHITPTGVSLYSQDYVNIRTEGGGLSCNTGIELYGSRMEAGMRDGICLKSEYAHLDLSLTGLSLYGHNLDLKAEDHLGMLSRQSVSIKGTGIACCADSLYPYIIMGNGDSVSLYGNVSLHDIKEFKPGESQDPMSLAMKSVEDPTVVYFE